jgi:plastocyanin
MRLAALLLLLGAAGCSQRVEHTIRMEGMKFVPETLTVRSGDLVIWQNTDLVPHTAVAAPRFDSGPIAPEGSFKVTLSQPGEIHYVCTLHPGMGGHIVVQPR